MNNKKSRAGGSASYQKNQINAGSGNKRFDVSNLNQFARFGQSFCCRKCGSDYHRFAVNGFCQRCQQRVEFIIREHPHIAQEIKNEKAEVRV